MPYFIETWDKPDHQQVRAAHRPAHLEFLAAHADTLLACGAKLHDDGQDRGGGVYIVAIEDRAEAEAFIAADPFSTAGLFERVSIIRWRKAYFDGRSFLA
ncbi:YciI family protein [Sphingomonas sp. CGMCC 1.13654]|uniref:YciI family protein n=1 Tax=Sphingomonas chungangi TaxID=2683589 RepID=A0A838L616_9SPHN|nr:YciI family protein [Sphingomonas chungangi]MBA2933909.1 YciI family protein [Sphingomonas chungangi]MVW55238.1 YciI family protein [Sphingomonas chungangi]